MKEESIRVTLFWVHHKLKGGAQMLPGDVNLPEVTFTPDDAVVNQLFNLLCIETDASFSKRFLQKTVRQLQNHLNVKLQGQLLCPDWANGILIRKG